MRHSIARAILACLRMFLIAVLPAKGKHRSPEPVAAPVSPPATPVTPPLPPLRRSPYAEYNANPEPLRGEDVPLIRPYLVAFEGRHSIYAERRATAELASYGIDFGPYVIHGRRLPA